MQHILKRLELIKTSIAIEDEEIIELQVFKLSTMPIDDDVQEILTKLSNSDYGSAVVEIENYLSRYSGVAVYEDKELGGLKLELKVLEAKLQELSAEKNEYLNDIHEFNVQYNLHLGDVIRKILELKKEILYKKTIFKNNHFGSVKEHYEQTKDELDELKEKLDALKQKMDETDMLDEKFDEIYEEFQKTKEKYDEKSEEFNDLKEEFEELNEEFENDPDNQEYKEAQNDYDEFSDEYEEIINKERFELNEDERIELKKAYRNASKLCHPDIVPDELKVQALKLMQELNEAYGKKDLKKVKEILTMLENGNGFEVASDSINDKQLLKSKIEDIRSKIDEVINEIDEIKSDDTFTTIQELEDWDEYFKELKADLTEEEKRLEAQKKSVLSTETEKQPVEDKKTNNQYADDDFWNSEF